MLRDRATVRNANFHSPAVRTPLKTPGSSSRMRRTPTARRAGVHGVLGMSASFSRKGRLPYSPARAEGGAQSDGEEEVLDFDEDVDGGGEAEEDAAWEGTSDTLSDKDEV